MKSKLFLFLLFICSNFYTASYSQETKGTVTIIRPATSAFAARRLKVFIDKKLVCRIHNKKFSTYKLEAGKHNFAIQSPEDGFGEDMVNDAIAQSRTIDVEPGKDYYLLVIIEDHGTVTEAVWFSGNIYFQRLLGNSYKNFLVDLEEEKECH